MLEILGSVALLLPQSVYLPARYLRSVRNQIIEHLLDPVFIPCTKDSLFLALQNYTILLYAVCILCNDTLC